MRTATTTLGSTCEVSEATFRFPLGEHGQADATAPGERERLRRLIDQTVAGAFDVEARLLSGPTRGRARVALARQVAMYVAHVGCGLSLTDVGEMFSRDRTTVAHACAIVELRRDGAAFDRALELVELIVRIASGPGGALRS